MRRFAVLAILAVMLATFGVQSATLAQNLPGAELLTPEELARFNDRIADAPDSATRARVRQEQIKLIQTRRLEARKSKSMQTPKQDR